MCATAAATTVQQEKRSDQNKGRTPPLAGMVLTSAFARTAGELAHRPLAAQLAAVPGGDAMLSAYDTSIEEFLAGRPVHVNEHLPEGLQQVILGITRPASQPFAGNCGHLARSGIWPESRSRS